jgi:type I restriction enzyme S subunit
MWQLNSDSTYRQAQLATAGATSPHVNVDTIRRFHLARPPYVEQRAIAEFLDKETAKLDQMASKVEAAIERLREYRSALITAAVTGKIDVRQATA